MINKKSREEIKLMKQAGHIVALCHQEIKNAIDIGVSTYDLDMIANKIIKENKAIPSFLGYHGYPASICASINSQVVHGIPSKDVILKDGDIVSIDIGATYRGLVGDSAWTYPVGNISDEKKRLLELTERGLFSGLDNVRNNAMLDDLSAGIEKVANENGLGIVRQYGGHGVGRAMHEEPFIFNYKVGSNVVLKSGMTLAVEPMFNLGCDDVTLLSDNWTVVTNDNKDSAHFEHSILVTDDGYEILTKLS